MKYNLLNVQDETLILVGVSKEEVMKELGITLSYFYESLTKGTKIKNKFKIERYGG